MNEILTTQETVRLCELERVIQRGKDTFVEVGSALSEIRDSRIYRATFKTFEDYCQKRWEFEKAYAFRMIAAAEVVSNLSPIGDKPKTESQARPLAKLPAEQQPAAWAKAQEMAKEEGKPVTARHVAEAVAEIEQPKQPTNEVFCEVVDSDNDEIEKEFGVGLTYAREAIFTLNRIPKRDPSRGDAIELVSKWLEENKPKRKPNQ